MLNHRTTSRSCTVINSKGKQVTVTIPPPPPRVTKMMDNYNEKFLKLFNLSSLATPSKPSTTKKKTKKI